MANERRSGGDTVAIFVRTLSGESTTVQVSSDGTINDLKIALKSSFPPASSSPNFHLFSKGTKLSLNSPVAAVTVNGGDFLVLVPFVKKERPQTPKPDFSEPSLSSKISNSTYSEMIREHSTLRDKNAERAESPSVGEKRKRDQETCPYDFLNGVLESDCKDAFKGHNTEKLSEVLKSRNCLTSPRSAKCLMSRDTSSSSCSCPDWLKLSMEAFTFLNIFSCFIETLGEKLYIARLKESLSRLAKSGVHIGIEDVKNLSLICPKVVKVIIDDIETVNHENAIVIANYLETDERSGTISGPKKTPLAKAFSAMKKRETSFKSELWKSIKSLQVKNLAVSLEDLIIFVTEGKTVFGNEARQAGKASVGSRSSQTLCQDTKSLLPLEMVEHLKNGIGCRGQYDEKYFGSGLSNSLELLKNRGFLSFDPSCDSSARLWTYIGGEKKPTQIVSIRAIESVKYTVVEERSKDVLDEIEESKAFFQVYEGAIYMNQGRTYLVTYLNIKEKITLCKLANVDYYTKTRDHTEIHITGGNTAYVLKAPKNEVNKTTAQTHPCRVTTNWFGFYRFRKSNNNIIDDVNLTLPSYSYKSQAIWIQVPATVKLAVEKKNMSFSAGLHAACHALLHVVPLYVRCNYSDLAPECPNPQETGHYCPTRILLYERHHGGTGISAKIRPFFTEVLEAALDLLTSCCCSAETGCPSCVQNFACQVYNEIIHKPAAIMIIQGILEAEKSYFQ